jgi:hypothetical protein
MQYIKEFFPEHYRLNDHGNGFDINLKNECLVSLPSTPITVLSEYITNHKLQSAYPHINFNFDFEFKKNLLEQFTNYRMHPSLTFKNFVCSFNGSAHVNRKLLVSILNKFKFFDIDYCSKNFSYTTDILEGHIFDYVGKDSDFYNKFFIGSCSKTFFKSINSFGHMRFDHKNNIAHLENRLTNSFLNLVSETMGTSYYPFVTEKFLYSIVTRGLFLAYAQPGWHDHLENYYGFKKYNRIFDYRFDTLQNPVKRLVELMSMISKFSILSSDDWRDLYEIEKDTIEYNYDQYFSRNYLKHLEQFCESL